MARGSSEPAAAVSDLNTSFSQMTASETVFSQVDTYQFFTIKTGTQAGGTVLVVAFLISLIQQKLAPQPNWKKAIVDLVWFTFLLASYAFVAGTLMRTVLSFGGLDPGAIAASGRTIFVDNLRQFADFQKNEVMEESTVISFATAGIATILQQLLSTAVAAFYTFAAAIVFALKIIQTTMIKVLWIVGPIMIGVAALPFQLTRRFLTSWVMAFIEVGTWGLFANILLGLMSTSWSQSGVQALGRDGSLNFFEHIAFNVVYAFAFACIPLLAATVIRGGGANGLASAGMGAAGFVAGKAAAASRAAGALGGGAGQSAGAGSGNGGSGAGGIGGAGQGAGGGADASDTAPTAQSPASTAAEARREHFARKASIAKQRNEGDV